MRSKRVRRGFTMIEVIASTIMLALIVTGVVSASLAIDNLRVTTRNSVYMSIHNLNCMERLRQQLLDGQEDMLLYYGDEMLGSDTIATQATLEPCTWDNFNIYSVTIESKMRDYQQRLTTEYVITDIGGVSYAEQANPAS